MNLALRSMLAKSWCFVAVVFASWAAPQVSADDPVRVLATDTIVAAFAASSAGYSSDEVLVNDDLRRAFLRELSSAGVSVAKPSEERDAFLFFLKTRKAGKLTLRAKQRGKKIDAGIRPIAEIAARVLTDRHKVTTDVILADPIFRVELINEAAKLAPNVDAYSVRKAVLALRKSRSLKPELVLKVADWDRTVQTYRINDLQTALRDGDISNGPGVYLFRDRSGYLYIGEASNLAKRLGEHLGGSDRLSLADYLAGDAGDEVSIELHVFAKNTPAARVSVRRAYESELIRSRNPKFNVRP